MRSIEEIIADTVKVNETSLREAFDAGRAAASAELKAKLATFVTEFMGQFDTPQPSPHTVPVEEHHGSDHRSEEQLPGSEHHEGEHHEDGHYN